MFLDFAIKVNPCCILRANELKYEKHSLSAPHNKPNVINGRSIILKSFSYLEFESFESSFKMAPNFMDNDEMQTQTWLSLKTLYFIITDLLMVTSKPNFITPFLEAYAIVLNTHKLSVLGNKGVGGKKTLSVLKINQSWGDD